MLSFSPKKLLLAAIILFFGALEPIQAFDGPPSPAAAAGDGEKKCEAVAGAISDQDWANMQLLLLSEKRATDIPEIATQEDFSTKPMRLRWSFRLWGAAEAQPVLDAMYKMFADRRVKAFINATGRLPTGEETFRFEGPRPNLNAHYRKSSVLNNVIQNWRTPYLSDGKNSRKETAVAVVQFLTRIGADPTFAPPGMKSPLRTAFDLGDYETVDYLLLRQEIHDLPADHEDRRTLLDLALLRSDLDEKTLQAIASFSKASPAMVKLFSSTQPDIRKLRLVIESAQPSREVLNDAIFWTGSFTSNEAFYQAAQAVKSIRKVSYIMADLKIEILQALLSAGGEINPTIFDGNVTAGPLANVLTVSYGPSEKWDTDILTMSLAGKLIFAGADISLPNKAGEVPLAIALQNYRRIPETTDMLAIHSTGDALATTSNPVDSALMQGAPSKILTQLRYLGYRPSPKALLALTRSTNPNFLSTAKIDEFFGFFPEAKIDDEVVLAASQTHQIIEGGRRLSWKDWATLKAQYEFLDALHRHGGNLAATNEEGFSVLININWFTGDVKASRVELNRLVVEATNTLNGETKYGDSALLLATDYKDWDSVRYFLEVPNVNVNAMDKRRIDGPIRDRALESNRGSGLVPRPIPYGRASVLDFAEDNGAPVRIISRLFELHARYSRDMVKPSSGD